MTGETGRLALWLSVLFAAWVVVAEGVAARVGREDLRRSAWRGLIASVASATVALAALIAGLATHDLTIRFVADTSSLLVPSRYLPGSLLGAPGGALVAFGALAGWAGVIAAGRSATMQMRIVIAVLVAVPLALSGIVAQPFALHFGSSADGAGLSPDLQRGAAVLAAVSLLAGCVCAAGGLLTTLAAIGRGALDDAWSARVRVWNAGAFVALLVGAVAGYRWQVMNPLRAGWLHGSAAPAWLFPAVTAGLAVLLDGLRPTNERALIRMLLSAVTAVAATGALAVALGAFVRGMDAPDPPRDAIWFAAIPAAGAVFFLSELRGARNLVAGASSIMARPAGRAASIVTALGAICLAVAVIGTTFTRTQTVTIGDAEIVRMRDPFGAQWEFAGQGTSTLKRENYASLTVSVIPSKNGVKLPMLSAEARSYELADERDAAPPAMIAGKIVNPFLETRLSIANPESAKALMRVEFIPFAPWLAVGAWLVAIGVTMRFAPRPAEPS